MLCGAIGALGLALVAAATAQPLTWALRGLTPAGILLVAVLLMGLGNGPRDRLLLPLSGLLVTVSVVFLTRTDILLATRQLMAIIMGVLLMVAIYFLIEDVRSLARLKYTAGFFALALLVVTMLWGKEVNGARLWLTIPHLVTFQSGEVAKLLMAIFLAGYIADRGELLRRTGIRRMGMRLPSLRPAVPLLVVVVFCLAMFVAQRDLGAAMLFFGLFVTMFYLATGQGGYGLSAAVLFGVGLVIAYYYFPHVSTRMSSWLNPWADPQGVGYQPLQAMFCLGEGGIFGAGIAQLPVTRLPAAATDLILVVVSQDLGLIGALGIVLVYALMSVRSYSLAWQATDRFAGLLAAALATVFSLQALIIMGGVLRVIPLTGITTPFLSYGGTSVVVNFLAIGLLLAISRDCVPQPEAADQDASA